MGAVFCSDHISRFGLLLQLGFADQCSFDGDEPCVCYKNGMPISDHPVFVLCWMCSVNGKGGTCANRGLAPPLDLRLAISLSWCIWKNAEFV